MISVEITFNGNSRVTLRGATVKEQARLQSAFMDATIVAVKPVEGGYEIVLEELKPAARVDFDELDRSTSSGP